MKVENNEVIFTGEEMYQMLSAFQDFVKYDKEKNPQNYYIKVNFFLGSVFLYKEKVK